MIITLFSDLLWGITTWSIIGKTVIFCVHKNQELYPDRKEKVAFKVEFVCVLCWGHIKVEFFFILDHGVLYNKCQNGWFEIQPGYEILLPDVPRDESESARGINSHQTEK